MSTAAFCAYTAMFVSFYGYWSLLCVYLTPWSFATICPCPLMSHLVVSRPSTPTGPLAWILLVEMPTSAPRPNLNPSANLVEALWKTQALSTDLRKESAVTLLSVTMQSVWLLPCLVRCEQG